MILKGQVAGGNGVGYVEVKRRIIKDLFAEAKLSFRPLLKRVLIPCEGLWLQHFPRTPTASPSPELRLQLGLSSSLRPWMVLGSQIYSVCNVKPNFTQPRPVDVLWDLLCREQVSGMLCPSC